MIFGLQRNFFKTCQISYPSLLIRLRVSFSIAQYSHKVNYSVTKIESAKKIFKNRDVPKMVREREYKFVAYY